jgi:hypothetical protein
VGDLPQDLEVIAADLDAAIRVQPDADAEVIEASPDAELRLAAARVAEHVVWIAIVPRVAIEVPFGFSQSNAGLPFRVGCAARPVRGKGHVEPAIDAMHRAWVEDLVPKVEGVIRAIALDGFVQHDIVN